MCWSTALPSYQLRWSFPPGTGSPVGGALGERLTPASRSIGVTIGLQAMSFWGQSGSVSSGQDKAIILFELYVAGRLRVAAKSAGSALPPADGRPRSNRAASAAVGSPSSTPRVGTGPGPLQAAQEQELPQA